MLLGGGDIPGDIAARPELHRPTSLLAAESAILRMDLCSQRPLALTENGVTPGLWSSDAFRTTWAQTLGEDQRLAVGVGSSSITDLVRYEEDSRGYGVRLRESRYSAAAAWRFDKAWVGGISSSWGTLVGSAEGSIFADALSLPQDTHRWPSIETNQRSHVLGLSYHNQCWRLGASRGWGDPSATLRLSRDRFDFVAPMSLSTDWYEFWAAYHAGDHRWWASVRDSEMSGSGTVLTGMLGRGDVRTATEDVGYTLGWRQERERSLTQAQVDWRRNEAGNYLQGYVGLLPGIAAEIYTIHAEGEARTRSLRLGHLNRIGGPWSWAAAGSIHQSDLNSHFVIRRARGLAANPVVLEENRVEDGVLKLWAMTLGLVYDDGDIRATLSGTAGLAELNDAFDDVIDPVDPVDPAVSRGLEVRPLFTAALEWRF